MPVITALKKLYPEHIIPLHHQNAWQLLMAVILSAQCTDARVNTITPHLFKKISHPAGAGRRQYKRGGGNHPLRRFLPQQGAFFN